MLRPFIRKSMKRTVSFQEKLKHIVINRLIALIGAGILLLAFGMILAVVATNYKNAKDNGKLYEDRFTAIYEECSDFLSGEALQKLCLDILLYKEDTSALPYLIYEFNASSPLKAKVVLSDKERNILFHSFKEWDLYRNSFNKAICANAFHIPRDEIYSSVYYFDGNNSNYVLSKPIYDQEMTVGFINLYLEEEGWEQSLADAEYEGIIADERGRVIYSSKQSFVSGVNKFDNSSHSPIITINGRRYWCNKRYIEKANVAIYSLIYYPRSHTLLLTAFGVIITIGICWYKLARNMTEAMAESNAASINKLVSEIQVISQEDSEYRINTISEDEFSAVGIQINQMLDNIQELNHRNTELLRINNVTEINHLTEQINPHFLYNTLEIIRNLLIFDSKKADRLIIQLTQILRYSINTSRKYVYLEEDMSYIRDYLEIQKTRFEDSLHYELHIDEDCNKCIIPKLILQPLIENSIKYGFRKKTRIHIWIEGHMEGNMLLLSVRDNGEGMVQEEAEALQKSIYEPVLESEHNGLHNIARRLYLLYGTDSGLDITNLETEGLMVTIKINLKGE